MNTPTCRWTANKPENRWDCVIHGGYKSGPTVDLEIDHCQNALSQPESPKPYSADELAVAFRVPGTLSTCIGLVPITPERLRATAEHLRSLELQVAKLEARVQRYEVPPTMEEADDIHDIYLEHKARCTDLAMCEDDTGSQEDWHGCHGHVAFELLERFLSGRRERVEASMRKCPCESGGMCNCRCECHWNVELAYKGASQDEIDRCNATQQCELCNCWKENEYGLLDPLQ